MQTILGAGGAIGAALLDALSKSPEPLRLVSRHPLRAAAPVQWVSADLSDPDQTIAAVAGSRIAYLLVGLKYDTAVWRELWPRIMRNTIEACQRAGAKLVFFDNVYAYGKVAGPMTEQTPFNPCSRKGEIRAQVAAMLLEEVARGNLIGLIARSADFYGPNVRNSIANLMVIDRLAKGSKALWLVDDSVPHSWTYAPDAGQSLCALVACDTAWNQTWHVPTAPDPPTGERLVAMAAAALGTPPRCQILGRPLLKLAGLINSDIRESYEMLYQYDSAYVFDSSKIATLGLTPTDYAAGIARCVQSSS
jgi:nucleoside-diphosphate-sugar epimerase